MGTVVGVVSSTTVEEAPSKRNYCRSPYNALYAHISSNILVGSTVGADPISKPLITAPVQVALSKLCSAEFRV